MLHLLHIDLVVVLVCADPLDPHDTLLEIDGHDQPVIIALDVEDDPVGRDDAGSRVAALYICRARPPRLSDFVEPSVQGRLQRAMVLISPASFDEFSQSTPGNDPHAQKLPCAQIGRKPHGCDACAEAANAESTGDACAPQGDTGGNHSTSWALLYMSQIVVHPRWHCRD